MKGAHTILYCFVEFVVNELRFFVFVYQWEFRATVYLLLAKCLFYCNQMLILLYLSEIITGTCRKLLASMKHSLDEKDFSIDLSK